MDVHDLVLPRMFAEVKLTLWLPGPWPGRDELAGDDGERSTIQRYVERHEELRERARAALRAGARVPLLCGDVAIAFWHHRAEWAPDRTQYTRTAESAILPALIGSGCFRAPAVRAVTHLFDRAVPDAEGIYVLVSEHPADETEGATLAPSARPVLSISPTARRRRPRPGQLAFSFRRA